VDLLWAAVLSRLLGQDREEDSCQQGVEIIGVRRGVSKGEEDGHRLPALQAATPETAVRPIQRWPPARHKGVGHDKP